MITAIAIDDEPLAIKVIEHHLSKINGIVHLKSFHNTNDALLFLKQNPIDLIFLDINMPGFSGLELLNQLRRKPQVIFTTAYEKYAVDSYNYNAVDYLLKPFEFDRFQIAIDKALKRFEDSKLIPDYIFIKDGLKNIRIELDDILFIKGSGNYLEICTDKKKFYPRLTFAELTEKIPSTQFIRIHQSFIVNIAKVEKVENNHVHTSTYKMPISERYRNGLLRRIEL